MVKQTNLNLLLISLICGFGVSLGVLVLLYLAGVRNVIMAPVFVIGVAVLSYFFYRMKDIKLVLSYSLIATGALFVLFPAFMYLGIPQALPGKEIKISLEQFLMISIATGVSALVLAIALIKSPLRER